MNILDKIVAYKKQEIAKSKRTVSIDQLRDQIASAPDPRDFLKAIQSNPFISLIAEVKKASPSKGVIRADFNPVEIAKIYQANGASCVSVLTDEAFFQGHLDYLTQIRHNIELPLLRKDFIVDPYQVYQARAAGADAVLLIAECLTKSQLKNLHDQIVELRMIPLVEFYRPENLDTVLDSGAKLIGINNRDLNTFETNISHCIRMRQQIPTESTVVGESGIFTADDVAMLRESNIDAMLVGESLMKSADIGFAVRALLNSDA